MEKRTFLKTGFWLTVSAAAAPLINACKGASKAATPSTPPSLPEPTRKRALAFSLPALGFETSALEPNIDKMTMEIHHGKHHQAYVNNLNDAVKEGIFREYELEDILLRIGTGDADKKIRNNGGGHWNHSFFWQIIAPSGPTAPSGALASAIDAQFGSLDKMKQQFTDAAKGVFGSGWAWLCVGKDKKLFVSSTPNQDNPLMQNIVKQVGTPILGIDVWEHAYYLKYQNKRPDYINAFYNVVNWKEVNKHFEMAMSK